MCDVIPVLEFLVTTDAISNLSGYDKSSLAPENVDILLFILDLFFLFYFSIIIAFIGSLIFTY